jgi:hypothetical protein
MDFDLVDSGELKVECGRREVKSDIEKFEMANKVFDLQDCINGLNLVIDNQLKADFRLPTALWHIFYTFIVMLNNFSFQFLTNDKVLPADFPSFSSSNNNCPEQFNYACSA